MGRPVRMGYGSYRSPVANTFPGTICCMNEGADAGAATCASVPTVQGAYRILAATCTAGLAARIRFRNRMTMNRPAALSNTLLALCLIGQAASAEAEDRYLAHSAQVESLSQIAELMVSDLAMARIAARQAERPEVREFADDVVRDLGAVCTATQTALATV